MRGQQKPYDILYIYKITNKENGMGYIGSTGFLEKRQYQHFLALNKGVHPNIRLQKDYNKFGREAFEVIVLDSVAFTGGRQRIELESEYIKKTDNLYNFIHKEKPPKHLGFYQQIPDILLNKGITEVELLNMEGFYSKDFMSMKKDEIILASQILDVSFFWLSRILKSSESRQFRFTLLKNRNEKNYTLNATDRSYMEQLAGHPIP